MKMKINDLKNQIKSKQSFLCIGLDPEISKIGYETPLNFCKKIIDQTIDHAVSYKINSAFFESLGSEGWSMMECLFDYLQNKNVFIICDSKRGDINSTSIHYSKSVYDKLKSHAVTLNPIMGQDSLQPFLDRDKVSIFLGLTSNPDASQILLRNFGGEKVYQMIINETKNWESKSDKMWVIGATNQNEFKNVKKVLPNEFLLVPGVGHQGGSLEEVVDGLMIDTNILINMSRSIIYSKDPSSEAKKVRDTMKKYL